MNPSGDSIHEAISTTHDPRARWLRYRVCDQTSRWRLLLFQLPRTVVQYLVVQERPSLAGVHSPWLACLLKPSTCRAPSPRGHDPVLQSARGV